MLRYWIFSIVIIIISNLIDVNHPENHPETNAKQLYIETHVIKTEF
jgi:hypothetical protein